jgi:hypothetical protein
MDVDTDALSERLASVERRLTDADDGTVGEIGAVEGRLADLEERADEIETRVERLESGLQATRGLLGGVDAVDESVERRADLALAKAEEIERRLDADESPADPTPTPDRRAADDGRTVRAAPATEAGDGRATGPSATADPEPRSDDASERSAGLVGRLRGLFEEA